MTTGVQAVKDPLGAFCQDSSAALPGGPGPLANLTFAAKDLYDIAGYVTGGGNPDWARTHGPAAATAWAVARLNGAGAAMVGKTHTDELSRGIFGENTHFGTPINPRAPGRVPGGSSSGSATAVAGNLVDFALGTDTGGSVRVPASYCGIYGIRPSHGRVPLDGVIGQAPSYDTAGWFARDAATLARVGEVLVGRPVGEVSPRRVVIAEDAFAVADRDVADALRPWVETVIGRVGASEVRSICPTDLAEWALCQGTLQRREAWESFKDWIERTNPRFGFDVAELFAAGAGVDDETQARARLAKREIVPIIEALLGDGTVICLPAAPFVAPPRGLPRSTKRALTARISKLTCIAGLVGAPQISVPVTNVGGLPIALSLIAARGEDEMLLSFARSLAVTPGRRA